MPVITSTKGIYILFEGLMGNQNSAITYYDIETGVIEKDYFLNRRCNRYQIERIEILKGGQSTIYGSDAVAGVINIITKRW